MGRYGRRWGLVVASLVLAVALAGCTGLQKKRKDQHDPMEQISRDLTQKPMPPDQAQELLGEMGENWLYGQGVGQTVLNAGAIYIFPPYGLYVLGNSLLSFTGYEPLYVSNLLPDEEKKQFNFFYDNLTSAPGRVNAAIAGKEYRSQDVVRHRLEKFSKGDYNSEGTTVASRGRLRPEMP